MKISNFRGCVFGQALGDSLGFVVEGSNSQVCRTYLAELNESNQLITRERFKPGQFSDDTQLLLELLASLTIHSGFNSMDFASRIGQIFESNDIVGRGMATQAAADKIIAGYDLAMVATPAPAAGNGTAMRAASIGLFYHNSKKDIQHYAVRQSKITHVDDRCSAGSVIIASAVAYLADYTDVLNEETKVEFIDFLISQVGSISPLFTENLIKLKGTFDLQPLGAMRIISTWGDPDFLDGWKYISPYVIPSVCWALWCFLKYSNSYKNAVFAAIAGGGDTDTTAAMVGAMTGAYLGFDALPQTWVKLVHDRDRWNFQSIDNLISSYFSS